MHKTQTPGQKYGLQFLLVGIPVPSHFDLLPERWGADSPNMLDEPQLDQHLLTQDDDPFGSLQ